MKTVQINSVCGFGSTGKITVEISKRLNGAGIENRILYGVGQSDYRQAIKFGSTLNVASHQIKTRLLGKHGFYSKVATRELVDALQIIEPDIVHLHNLHGHYLNIELLFDYLSKVGKPVIWTMHDCWSFTGHCVHFDYIGCEKWKTGCYRCPQLSEYPGSLVFDRSKQSYLDKRHIFRSLKDLTIVTPSRWLAGLAKESFLGQYPITTIQNGIDLNVFKPIKSGFRKRYDIENKFVILSVANFWGERKGYNYLLELSKLVSEDQVMVVLGVDEKQKNELPPNIIGLQRTDTVRELVEIYSAADVFVNPTLEEVFGMVNVEALACGTPVVTFDTGGSPETIDDKTGISVERGNLDEMLRAVNTIKSIGKEFYSSHCIERAKNRFDTDKSCREYLRIYREIEKRAHRGED